MKKWFGILKNGLHVSEPNSPNSTNLSWNNIKKQLKSLSINNNNQIITLPSNLQYIQGKTASANLNGNVQIESRYIGFILGNNIVKIRINETNNNINIELSDLINLTNSTNSTNPENVPTKTNPK